MEKLFIRIKVFKRFEGGFFEIVDRRHEMEECNETIIVMLPRTSDDDPTPIYATVPKSRMVERDHVILRTQNERRADMVLEAVSTGYVTLTEEEIPSDKV